MIAGEKKLHVAKKTILLLTEIKREALSLPPLKRLYLLLLLYVLNVNKETVK